MKPRPMNHQRPLEDPKVKRSELRRAVQVLLVEMDHRIAMATMPWYRKLWRRWLTKRAAKEILRNQGAEDGV